MVVQEQAYRCVILYKYCGIADDAVHGGSNGAYERTCRANEKDGHHFTYLLHRASHF